MSVKNFREDIDIKPGAAASSTAAAAETFNINRAEIRTMAKDLAMVRTHLPQKGKVNVAGEGPKTVLDAELFRKEPIAATAPPRFQVEPEAKAMGSLLAPVVKPLAPPPRPPASKPLRPRPALRSEIKQLKAKPIFEHRRSLSFVRVFFEALLAMAFFSLLLAGAAYWWTQIKGTELLLTQLPVTVRVPPMAPNPSLPTPPAAVTVSPSLLVTDQTQEIVFPAVPDAVTLQAQLDGVRRSTIRPGEFLRLSVLTGDRTPVDARALATALAVPLPSQPCPLSQDACNSEPYSITNYTLFIFGESPINAVGAVARLNEDVSFNALEAANSVWETQLSAFVQSVGLVSTANHFESGLYREAQIRYLNFTNGTALDIIVIPSQRLMAFTTSRESALRLIDRALLNSSISYPQVIP